MLKDNIHAEHIEIGIGVTIHPSAVIRGLNGLANRISIGDHTYIGADVQIICDDFKIGDYSKIHHHTNIYGYQPCSIGHNAWIGQYVIIDSIGKTEIGNNCGIGAASHLWSHVKFGDTLNGCRFNSHKPLIIGNDVWITGHCTISPITAADKSMVLAGSVVTEDLAYNNIYAGQPAKSISHKIGYQFIEPTIDAKRLRMEELIEIWGGNKNKIKITEYEDEMSFNDDVSYFNINNRTYTKKNNVEEISFMKFLLPEKAKFIPLLR